MCANGMHVSNQSTVKFFVSNRPAKMKFLNAGSSLNKEQRFPGEPREKSGNKKEESSPVAQEAPNPRNLKMLAHSRVSLGPVLKLWEQGEACNLLLLLKQGKKKIQIYAQ